MKEMQEKFIPRLNRFSELLKETYSFHIENILRLDAVQKDLLAAKNRLQDQEQLTAVLPDTSVAKYLAECSDFEKSIKAWQTLFHKHITDTNLQLGLLSSHWGGYIEHIGVQFMLGTLKREYKVHTTFQKFKRWWHKSRNVEIDLLAISDTHAYVVEVKNQLKEETFKQMLVILEKIKEKVPEYEHLIIQPVFICVHADSAVVNTGKMSGLWIVRYKGFDRENPVDEFEWLRKDNIEPQSSAK